LEAIGTNLKIDNRKKGPNGPFFYPAKTSLIPKKFQKIIIKSLLERLREQRENMTPGKAKKLLKQPGIWRLLVPIEKEKKKRRSAGRPTKKAAHQMMDGS